jgi:hypothetical protein
MTNADTEKIERCVRALRASHDELGLLIESDPKAALELLDRARNQLYDLVSAFGDTLPATVKLLEPSDGMPISGIEVPKELYWVLGPPTPLAGMKYPRRGFPWQNLKNAGFSQVVSLHPGSYDPAPLQTCFAEHLEDLVGGGPPANQVNEKTKIKKAVSAAVAAWRSGQGVVVHCYGGRGRSGTVLGCVLRELGFAPAAAIGFLDCVHKARGKPGWPESPWQSSLVENWETDA